MLLLVIRHAIAATRTPSASDEEDALRSLTKDGRRKMAAGAKGLRRIVPELDLLAASPLVRAQQTAAIVANEYGGMKIVTTPVPELASTPASFVKWLRAMGTHAVSTAPLSHRSVE